MANATETLLNLLGVGTQLNRLGDLSSDVRGDLRQLGEDARRQTRFRPFTVTAGGLGTADVGPRGGFTSTLSGPLQDIQDTALAASSEALSGTTGDPYLRSLLTDFRASQTDPRTFTRIADNKRQAFDASGEFTSQALQPTAEREQDIFERIRATQRPQEERAQQAIEQRLFSQGRSGITSNQFGGTPEQLAFEKARAEASNNAMLTALQQAQQERNNLGRLGLGFGQQGITGATAQQNLASRNVEDILGLSRGDLTQRLGAGELGQGLLRTGIAPGSALLNALNPAVNLSNLAQTGQLAGTSLATQLGLGGAQVQTNLEKLRTDLIGGLFGSLANAAQGANFDPIGDIISGIPGLFSRAGSGEGAEGSVFGSPEDFVEDVLRFGPGSGF